MSQERAEILKDPMMARTQSFTRSRRSLRISCIASGYGTEGESHERNEELQRFSREWR
jgi:hypothetical protein